MTNSELFVLLTAIGGLVLGLGLFSSFLKGTILSLPLVCLSIGIVLGPRMADLVDPLSWPHVNTLIEESARLTIAIGLMGVALRLPRGYAFARWKPLVILILLVLPLMALSGALIAYLLFGLPILVAFLVGAIISPTDPIVATTIVTGALAEKYIPHEVRHTMSLESGANDGLAYPMVLLPILLIEKGGQAWSHWFLHTILWETGGAIILGSVLGLGIGHLLHFAERKNYVEETSFLAYTVALTILVLGCAELIGMNGILAVFTAGLSSDYLIGGGERAEEENVQEAVNQFFTLPIFLLLGLVLPWDQWFDLGIRGILFCVAILFLRRIPAMLLLGPWISTFRKPRETLFSAWFGPIGVAALLYASMALARVGIEGAWTLGTLAICTSLLAHGVTAAPMTRFYAKL